MDLRLEYRDPAELDDNPANWRAHPDAQAEGLDAVLDEVGWAGAALYNEATGRLIDGHLRKKRALARSERVPVLVGSWTEEQERLILATLDPLAAMADVAARSLKTLLDVVEPTAPEGTEAIFERLRAEAEAAMAAMQAENAVADPGAQMDKAAELQEKWQVSSGDIFQCGEHFVICGDCREPETWKRLLTAAGVDKVNGVFTSPPYAMQRAKQYGGTLADEYVDWWEAVQANVRSHLTDDGSFFVNIKPHCKDGERVLYVFDLVMAMKRRWRWCFVEELVWVHYGYPGEHKPRFKNRFEPIYQFSLGDPRFCPENVLQIPKKSSVIRAKLAQKTGEDKQGRKYASTGTGTNLDYQTMTQAILSKGKVRPGNVLEFSADAGHSGFSNTAQFPLSLPAFFVKAYSDELSVWCDPFLGSGTTICAAHQNSRRGVGIEKLEKYVAVTLERLAGMGLEPRRVERGM